VSGAIAQSLTIQHIYAADPGKEMAETSISASQGELSKQRSRARVERGISVSRNRRWEQIDLLKRLITVGKAKSRKGANRQSPTNGDLFAVLSMQRDWFQQKFGETKPEHYLFPSRPRQGSSPHT
jgi:hypothetical protein